MRNQPFYIKNREYLESKTLLSFLFSQQRREAISTIWKGEASMIK